jgi:hypothetical protein
MPNTPTVTGVQKEMVFGGPGTQPNAVGTVYNGPGLSGTTARPNPAIRPVQPKANAGGSKGRNVFYLIAVFSAINAVLILSKAPIVFALGLACTRVSANSPLGPVLFLNAIAIGTFVALGFFAARGAKAAFLIGLLLYAGDTVVLVLSPNAAAHIVSIVFHGLFLFYIFQAFRQVD